MQTSLISTSLVQNATLRRPSTASARPSEERNEAAEKARKVLNEAASKLPQEPAKTKDGDPPAQPKKWTYLFYINGNNFLSKQAPAQLRMLELAGGSDDNLNVVAQVARMKGSLDGMTKDWSGVRRYEVPDTGMELDQNAMSAEMLRELVPPYTRGIVSFMKDDLLDADMGDPKTLSDFIKWGVQNYPAEHYCVVMLGPSQGMKGVMHDETTNHQMSPDQLKSALDDAAKATGKKVDIVAFDASNATQAEMLYALKDSTHYVIGSEGLVSGTGLSTPSVMFELKKSSIDKTRTPEEVAQTFSMVSSMAVSQASFAPTTSCVDVTKMDGIRDAVNGFGSALINANLDKQHLRDLVDDTQEVAMPGDTRAYEGVKDIYHFAQLVSQDATITDATVKAAAKQVMTSVDDALIGEAHQGGPYRNAHGISIFLPDNYGFIRPDTSPATAGWDHKFNYEDLAFAKDSSWPKFLSSIAQDSWAGRTGTKLLGEKGYDSLLGFQRQWMPAVNSLGNLASTAGWWESVNILNSGRPGSLLGIPATYAAEAGAVGGVYDMVQGVAAGIQAYKDEKSADAIIMNGIDVVGGLAKSAACVALLHPGAVPFAYAAGIFGFAKPWLKDAFGYYMQYKQIRDSIALTGPDVSQRCAVEAAHIQMNKNFHWDK